MRDSPQSVRFDDLLRVCEAYFGPPRNHSGSHVVYRTPWSGDPRINIQRFSGGQAKPYQVKQVLAAIDKLTAEEER